MSGSVSAGGREISIHALRVEGDTRSGRHYQRFYISIHALRVEGDTNAEGALVTCDPFLSTPSGWRATIVNLISDHVVSHFYPRPPGGGRPCSTPPTKRSLNFYPRPPGGGRPPPRPSIWRGAQFLSTPSGWRATSQHPMSQQQQTEISIHALRVEGDSVYQLLVECQSEDFYPRPPGGGRPAERSRATRTVGISIHALRVEGDCANTRTCVTG